MMGYGWGSMGWMPFMGIFFWLLILVLAVAVVMAFTRRSWRISDQPPKTGPHSTGIQVLEERYARGEIPRDEYLQKKRDILGSGID